MIYQFRKKIVGGKLAPVNDMSKGNPYVINQAEFDKDQAATHHGGRRHKKKIGGSEPAPFVPVDAENMKYSYILNKAQFADSEALVHSGGSKSKKTSHKKKKGGILSANYDTSEGQPYLINKNLFIDSLKGSPRMIAIPTQPGGCDCKRKGVKCVHKKHNKTSSKK